MDKLTMKSVDITGVNIERIAQIFPNVITEVESEDGSLKKAIDFELLKQELSDNIVDGEKERYQLTWPGKKEAVLLANTPIDNTLRPVKEDSVDWDNTKNLYIEGDNLEVLKLLQESYLNKVKCIYIDPPYNTGRDFIYKDDFRQTTDEYLEESGQVDEEGNRLFQNNESNGRFHSDWLTMMYSRLKLARNLLKDDGVIFISIDDNEVDNLRKICDEAFSSQNFIATIIWEKVHTRKNSTRYFSTSHDYILCYAKMKKSSNSDIGWDRGLIPRENTAAYKNPDNDSNGPWKPDPITAHNYYSANYTITKPSGIILERPVDRYWAYSEESWFEKVRNGAVIWGEGDSYPMIKRYLSDVQDGLVPITLFDREFAGDTSFASRELNELFGYSSIFDYSKPSLLIKRLMQIAFGKEKEGIILDFFSGSASTADAVMQVNAKEGGTLKYIMVQLPEKTANDSEACKDGFKNICEIGKERIRRAAKKIKNETKADIDYGFRVYQIDSSNMKDVYYNPDEISQGLLKDLESNIKDDRTSEDILIQVMLECGLELSLPMETKTIHGRKVHFVADNSLVACFDTEVPEEVIKVIAKEQPLRVVFRDRSFKNDADRINVEELFKMLSPGTEIKVI